MADLHRRKDDIIIVAEETSSGHNLPVIVTEEVQRALYARFERVVEAVENVENQNDLLPYSPKIRKVRFLRSHATNLVMYYEPRVISFGPIHHGKPKYQLGEKYKLGLTSEFVKNSGKGMQDLYQKIENEIKKLRDCFEEEVTKDYDDESLACLLFVDGCAILQFIYCVTYDNFKKLKIENDIVAFGNQDLFLLENQLPYCLLEWLMSSSKMEKQLKRSIQIYVEMQLKERKKKDDAPFSISMYGDSYHLLDVMRTGLLGIPKQNFQIIRRKRKNQDWQSYCNVQMLQATGIYLKRSNSSCLRDISFTKTFLFGYLFLPPIIVDDSTRTKFLNLIAYEMCLDFENDLGVTSYISFLDSLITDANDVKELRKAGILYNLLGSDEEVAKLFNEMGTDLVPNPKTYKAIKIEIQNHYDKKLSWMFRFYNDHFGGTWSIAGFLGVLFGLVLGGIQAWFTVKPASQKHV